MLKRAFIGLITGLVVVTTATATDSQDNMMAPGIGPDRMPGMMPGMMPGAGAGMGPGMNGRNMRPGMGPGNMGRNMGRNMGPGMGPGMGIPQRPGPFAGIQFNENQQKVIREMMQRARESNWQRMQSMGVTQEKLQRLYMSERWDVAAIKRLYDDIFTEQKKTIEAMAMARNAIYELLDKEQKEQMKMILTAQQERMRQMREIYQQRTEQMPNRQQPVPR